MAHLARAAGRAFVRSATAAAASPSVAGPSSSSSAAASLRSFSTSAALAKPPTSPTYTDADGKQRRRLIVVEKSGQAQFKTYLPVTPSLRQLRRPVSEHLHKGGPYRPLTIAKRGTGGRNDLGRVTTRARGGGHRRRIRNVDFVRRETGEQEVVRIEYDPGRSAHIALLKHKATGTVSYIIAPGTLRAGDTVQSFRSGIPDSFLIGGSGASTTAEQLDPTDPSAPQTVTPPTTAGVASASSSSPSLAQIDISTLRSLALRPGNCLPIRLIPVGTVVHGISLSPDGPAVLERAAGGNARIISASSPTGKHAQVRLSSGEVRLVHLDCVASIGTVSNADHQHTNYGKAGRVRWLGFRPQTRGVAMNPRDHPHGGGRGKSKGGNHPVSFSNVGAKGQRTRAPSSKNGNKMVVKERKKRS